MGEFVPPGGVWGVFVGDLGWGEDDSQVSRLKRAAAPSGSRCHIGARHLRAVPRTVPAPIEGKAVLLKPRLAEPSLTLGSDSLPGML